MNDLFREGGTGTGEGYPRFLFRRKYALLAVIGAILLAAAAAFAAGLAPAGSGPTVPVTVSAHEGFSDIAGALSANHLLRSRMVFEAAALLSGVAFRVPSGTYLLSSDMSVPEILRELSRGPRTVTVTIPEGSDLYQIDRTLADAGVITRGALIGFAADGNLEGWLFPDTYQFFEGSDIATVVQKFLDNFAAKAGSLLPADPSLAERTLTLASLIEQEAPDAHNESMIAGIIEKRLKAGMPLQIDATVCYAKQIALPGEVVDCSALTHGDFASSSPYRSPYNTYLYKGLPPGPIGNPGIVAITAAIHPIASPYWYYLSDPATGKIIYAATLAEQETNIKKYLRP